MLRSKAPFTGELVQCGSQREGQVGYASGSLGWEDAGRRVCEAFAAETDTPCQNNAVEVTRNAVQRDQDGAYYRVTARRRLPVTAPVEFEFRTYRVAKEGGQQVLLARERVRCDDRTCTPVAEPPARAS